MMQHIITAKAWDPSFCNKSEHFWMRQGASIFTQCNFPKKSFLWERVKCIALFPFCPNSKLSKCRVSSACRGVSAGMLTSLGNSVKQS